MLLCLLRVLLVGIDGHGVGRGVDEPHVAGRLRHAVARHRLGQGGASGEALRPQTGTGYLFTCQIQKLSFAFFCFRRQIAIIISLQVEEVLRH